MRFRSAAAPLLVVLPAFSCASPAKVNVEEGWAVGNGVSGGIGHYACAVMLSLDVEVVDGQGKPVGSAEVWELMDYPDAPDKARHLGSTDDSGRFKAPFCLMDTNEFERWQPDERPVVVNLLVFRENLGGKRVAVRPDTFQVLAEGNVVGVTPEEYRRGVRASPNPEMYKRKAPVGIKVVL